MDYNDIKLLTSIIDIDYNNILDLSNKFNLDLVSTAVIYEVPEDFIIYENYNLVSGYLNEMSEINKNDIITNININILKTKQFIYNINKKIDIYHCFISLIKIIFKNCQENYDNYKDINEFLKSLYIKIIYLIKLIKKYKNNDIIILNNNKKIYKFEYELLNFLFENSIIYINIYKDIFDKILYIFYNEKIDLLSEESIIIWYENIESNRVFNIDKFDSITGKCKKFISWLKK